MENWGSFLVPRNLFLGPLKPLSHATLFRVLFEMVSYFCILLKGQMTGRVCEDILHCQKQFTPQPLGNSFRIGVSSPRLELGSCCFWTVWNAETFIACFWGADTASKPLAEWFEALTLDLTQDLKSTSVVRLSVTVTSTQGEPLKGGKVYSGSQFQRCQFIMPGRVWWSRGGSHHRGQEAEREEGTWDQIQPSLYYSGDELLPARTTPKVSCSS